MEKEILALCRGGRSAGETKNRLHRLRDQIHSIYARIETAEAMASVHGHIELTDAGWVGSGYIDHTRGRFMFETDPNDAPFDPMIAARLLRDACTAAEMAVTEAKDIGCELYWHDVDRCWVASIDIDDGTSVFTSFEDLCDPTNPREALSILRSRIEAHASPRAVRDAA